uniref:Uncharacterized protein n=1 Tax=Setaria viridis TaxID=4556 RepID=A0A4U6VFG6_SETVI|nr:hypothetical protein SEVIR_3G261250v2 [Setaria viridis]
MLVLFCTLHTVTYLELYLSPFSRNCLPIQIMQHLKPAKHPCLLTNSSGEKCLILYTFVQRKIHTCKEDLILFPRYTSQHPTSRMRF